MTVLELKEILDKFKGTDTVEITDPASLVVRSEDGKYIEIFEFGE